MQLYNNILGSTLHQHPVCQTHWDFENLQHLLNSLTTQDTGQRAFTERDVHGLKKWYKLDKMTRVPKLRSNLRIRCFRGIIYKGQCMFLGIRVNVMIVICDCIIVKLGLRLPVLYTMTPTGFTPSSARSP